MAETTYEFSVKMTCGGCTGAVERVLKKLGTDVSNVDISLEQQRVLVTTKLSSDEIFEQISKTGKETKFVGEKSA